MHTDPIGCTLMELAKREPPLERKRTRHMSDGFFAFGLLNAEDYLVPTPGST